MTSTLARVQVQPDPVRAVAARLDRVGAALPAMAVVAAGALSRAAPAVDDPGLAEVCASAAAATRIRLAGLGAWSEAVADRLRAGVEVYVAGDTAAARLVSTHE